MYSTVLGGDVGRLLSSSEPLPHLVEQVLQVLKIVQSIVVVPSPVFFSFSLGYTSTVVDPNLNWIFIQPNFEDPDPISEL